LKTLHLFFIALLVGSIFGYILLDNIGDPETDLAGFAVLMEAKYMNALVLIAPGLILTIVTGIALMFRRGMTPNKLRWMALKLGFVGLIALNGIFVLTPLTQEMATIASNAVNSGTLPAVFSELKTRENIFGAINMVMILTTMWLTVAKPTLRRTCES
jgi:uncharacterized membrane protein